MKKINLLFSLLIAGVFAFGQNAITLTAVTDFTTPAFGNTGKSRRFRPIWKPMTVGAKLHKPSRVQFSSSFMSHSEVWAQSVTDVARSPKVL